MSCDGCQLWERGRTLRHQVVDGRPVASVELRVSVPNLDLVVVVFVVGAEDLVAGLQDEDVQPDAEIGSNHVHEAETTHKLVLIDVHLKERKKESRQKKMTSMNLCHKQF